MGLRRLRFLAPLALVLFAAVGLAGAEEPSDDAIVVDRRGRDGDMPAPPLEIHEWGVWRIRGGRIDHLAELARENPSFVHRTSAAAVPSPALTPRRLPPEMMIADKPVIFIHAGTTMDVEVTVEFPGGEPWFYYPSAVTGVTEAPAARTLRWNGRVHSSVPANMALARAARGHWWSALRDANASPFVAAGTGQAERFLFYDGPVRFDRRTWRGGQATWEVANGRFTRRGSRGGDMRALRVELDAELRRQGLNAGESEALLRTWNGDLFRRAGRRSIGFITRAQYDAMLPITVVPEPIRIVRVGMVIEVS
jgi:hypothetical protein